MGLPGMPNIAGLTKTAVKAISCLLQNQKVLLEITKLQLQKQSDIDCVNKRIQATNLEIASLSNM